MARNIPWLRMGLLLACGLVWLVLDGIAHAQGVAMVTDLSGRVVGAAPVTILSEVQADARVEMAPGATLVVIYLKSGEEYSFSGPAQVEFQAGAPRVLSGAPARKRASPLARGGGVTIRPVAVTQAAFVMRSARPTVRIKLLTLSGTRTLDASPEFRWREIESGLTYRFELTDDAGTSLHEARIAGGAFRLPAEIQLREGITYNWEVSARTADGRKYVSAGEFSVAGSELRKEAASLRPAADASVSDRVAYAAWLDQAQLKDEARKYWKALSAERPADARLRALAGE